MSGIVGRFGKNTYCFLSECVICGKPYKQGENWRTVRTCNKERNSVGWWLYCADCWEKFELESDDSAVVDNDSA